MAGAAIQWLRDGLELLKKSSESEAFAESVDDTAGGYVVPAFTGLGAPYWDQYARGAVVVETNRCEFVTSEVLPAKVCL